MATDSLTIPAGQPLSLSTLITPTEGGIASRVLAKTTGAATSPSSPSNAGQGLEEHTSPFDALVMVLEGALALRIGGEAVRATPGAIVRMPGGVSHALDAPESARMLLIMLREPKPALRPRNRTRSRN